MAIVGALARPSPGRVDPGSEDIGLLFSRTARKGSLRTVKGKGSNRYVLTLRNPGRQVIWFQDRPGRQSGHLPLRHFIGSWKGFGFTDDPPNAALSVLGGAESQDTAILTLGRPRYNASKRRLRYPARARAEATGNLANFEHDHDPGAVKRFGRAALFIDDATADVLGQCVIQPFTNCLLADLIDADLSEADLTGARFCHTTMPDGATNNRGC